MPRIYSRIELMRGKLVFDAFAEQSSQISWPESDASEVSTGLSSSAISPDTTDIDECNDLEPVSPVVKSKTEPVKPAEDSEPSDAFKARLVFWNQFQVAPPQLKTQKEMHAIGIHVEKTKAEVEEAERAKDEAEAKAKEAASIAEYEASKQSAKSTAKVLSFPRMYRMPSGAVPVSIYSKRLDDYTVEDAWKYIQKLYSNEKSFGWTLYDEDADTVKKAVFALPLNKLKEYNETYSMGSRDDYHFVGGFNYTSETNNYNEQNFRNLHAKDFDVAEPKLNLFYNIVNQHGQKKYGKSWQSLAPNKSINDMQKKMLIRSYDSIELLKSHSSKLTDKRMEKLPKQDLFKITKADPEQSLQALALYVLLDESRKKQYDAMSATVQAYTKRAQAPCA